jgi:uncharacterized membrane protein
VIGMLVSLLVAVLVLGLVFWLISMLPGDARFKQIAQVILVIIALLWLAQVFFHPIPGFWYPRY